MIRVVVLSFIRTLGKASFNRITHYCILPALFVPYLIQKMFGCYPVLHILKIFIIRTHLIKGFWATESSPYASLDYRISMSYCSRCISSCTRKCYPISARFNAQKLNKYNGWLFQILISHDQCFKIDWKCNQLLILCDVFLQ